MSFIFATKGRASFPESKISQGILARGGLFVKTIAKMTFIRETAVRSFIMEKITRTFTRETAS